VKQTFPSGKELEGIGFLEAKRVGKSGKYEQLKWEQLERQLENSPVHRLLLYDNQPVGGDALPCFFCRAIFPISRPCELCRCTHAYVCPSRQALAYQKKTRDLHELCMPLSHQICLRYFLGYDLDYHTKVVRKVADGVERVDYLIVAHVVRGPEGEASVERVRFNRDTYGTLEHPHRENL